MKELSGGATNSLDGSYKAYPAGVSTFYDMAYQEAPVYRDPDSNTWFGFQAWPLERVAEMYYILAESGDLTSENFQMAKKVITKWIDWSKDYVFVGERPVTDAQGYYLNAAGQRILGGTNVQVAYNAGSGRILDSGWSGMAGSTGQMEWIQFVYGKSELPCNDQRSRAGHRSSGKLC